MNKLYYIALIIVITYTILAFYITSIISMCIQLACPLPCFFLALGLLLCGVAVDTV